MYIAIQFKIEVKTYTPNATPNFLMDSIVSSKGENIEKTRSCNVLPGSQRFKGREACWSSGMGQGRVTSGSIIHTNLHKPNNKLVSA
jgi:hypothetical protein